MIWGAVGLRSDQLFHSLTEDEAFKLAHVVSTASAEHDSVLFIEGGQLGEGVGCSNGRQSFNETRT